MPWPLAGVLRVWASATPANDRDWQTDVAGLPYTTFDGERVTAHKIRNFDYRSETGFTPPLLPISIEPSIYGPFAYHGVPAVLFHVLTAVSERIVTQRARDAPPLRSDS